MKKILTVFLLMAAGALGGCGWLFGEKGVFRDRGDDYRQATVEKPLVVPPGLSDAAVDAESAVPPVPYSASLQGRFEVPRPEMLDGNPDAELVKIQRLNDSSWILVEATPGEVWPRVRQFLTTNQLVVLRADAAAGIIETGWLQPTATDAPRERYRFQIEQGVQRGSSEVYVLQADTRAGEGRWPTASTNREREAEMTKVLAQFIADNGSTGAVSMLAQRTIDSKGKVFLDKKPGENPFLRLELPVERAWGSLSAALPKAGFVVDDFDRSASEFHVHYEPPPELEDKKGWWGTFWSWVFDGKEEDIHKDVAYVVRLSSLDQSADSAVRIVIAREDGKPLSAQVEEELLNHIKSKLS